MTVVVQDLIELAERCEKATDGDRETDADIGIAVGLFSEKHGLPGGGWVSRDEHSAIVAAPHYTGSLDAAMTLVPESLRKFAFIQFSEPAKAGFERDGKFTYFECATPALALCAAALRARASIKGDG